jgi:hypothetical protein
MSAAASPGRCVEKTQKPQTRDGRITIPLNYTVSPVKLSRMSELYPGYKFVPNNRGFEHSHPILAVDRRLTEEDAVRHLVELCQRKGIQRPRILDVGGGARHKHRNIDVHVIRPILDVQDVGRQNQDMGDISYCHHTLSQCNCTEYDAVLFIHSIYYIGVADVMAALRKARCHIGIGVFHEFLEPRGTFVDEASWEADSSGRVVMTVAGNSAPYVHPPFLAHRLKAGWRHDGSTITFCPRIQTPLSLSFVMNVENRLFDVEECDGIYAKHLTTIQPAAYEVLDLDLSQYWTWGTNYIYVGKEKKAIVVPKKLMSYATNYIWGRKRDAETLTSLVDAIRRHVSNCKDYPEAGDAVCMAAACVAFLSNIGNEIGLLGHIADQSATMRLHSELLKFQQKPAEHWHNWTLTTISIVLSMLFGWRLSLFPWVPVLCKQVETPITMYVEPQYDVIEEVGNSLASITGYLWFSYQRFDPVVQSVSEVICDTSLLARTQAQPYMVLTNVIVLLILLCAMTCVAIIRLLNYSALPDYAVPNYGKQRRACRMFGVIVFGWSTSIVPPRDPRNGPVAPAFRPMHESIMSITTSLAPAKVAPTSSLRTRFCLLDPRDRANTIAIGLTTRHTVTVFTSNYFNEQIAVMNRGICDLPVSPDKEFISSMVDFARQYIISHISENYRRVSFNEWNERFPVAQQKRHLAALSRPGWKSLPAVFCQKAFVKVERLLKYTGLFEHKESAPRLIQGCSDDYNVVVGPAIYGYSKHLSTLWNGVPSVEKGVGGNFFYASGYQADQISQVFDDCQCPFIYESDGTLWDRHMNPELLRLELAFYRDHIDAEAYMMIKHTIQRKIGMTKNGVLYTVEGTRASGEPNTSCGNSIINGITMLYAARQTLLADSDTPRQQRVLNVGNLLRNCRVFLLGDDNTLMSPVKLDVAKMRENLSRCGIEAKFKDTTRMTAEFCSCRFWMVGDNETLLGPKPGRVIPKLGWATNMNFPSREKLYEHVRGIALGMHASVNHIPVLRAIIATILRVTKGVASIPDPYAFHFKPSRMREATVQTFAQFEAIYGLSRERVLAFEAKLDRVKELPHRIDDSVIDVLVAVDT